MLHKANKRKQRREILLWRESQRCFPSPRLLSMLLLVTQFVSLQLHAFIIECTFLIPWLSRAFSPLKRGSLTLRGYFFVISFIIALLWTFFSCVLSCLRRFSREIRCFSLTHLIDALLSFSREFINLVTCLQPTARVIMSWLLIRLRLGEKPRKLKSNEINTVSINMLEICHKLAQACDAINATSEALESPATGTANKYDKEPRTRTQRDISSFFLSSLFCTSERWTNLSACCTKMQWKKESGEEANTKTEIAKILDNLTAKIARMKKGFTLARLRAVVDRSKPVECSMRLEVSLWKMFNDFCIRTLNSCCKSVSFMR